MLTHVSASSPRSSDRDTAGIAEEVLGLFVQQAALWEPMLDVREAGWRDAAHTLRGAAGLAVLGDGGASIILDIGSLLLAVDEAAMSVGL